LVTTAGPPTGPAPVEARFGNYRRPPPPVLHRWRPGLATTAPHPRYSTGAPPPVLHAGSSQTGLPPVQDRWGARIEREVPRFAQNSKPHMHLAEAFQSNRSRNGNRHARNLEIWQNPTNGTPDLRPPTSDFRSIRSHIACLLSFSLFPLPPSISSTPCVSEAPH
jgi:hypothetical protein